jgi:hypothetical protein
MMKNDEIKPESKQPDAPRAKQKLTAMKRCRRAWPWPSPQPFHVITMAIVKEW